jgi:hypothetical protein
MSFRPVPIAAGPAPTGQQLLFTPGPRLGWVFRDRRETALAYPEPRPDPRVIQAQAAARAAGAELAWTRAWRWAGKPSIALAVILVLLAGCQESVEASFNPVLTLVIVVVLCGPGLGYTGWCWLRRDQARTLPPEREYHQALAEWEERAAGHENAELARLAGQPEWGSVLLPGYRTDIFGGTLAGWQGLLTVHGASILAQRPLLTVDLTGQHAAGMLSAAARDAGISSATYHLPQQLGSCGLLTELTPAQLADAVAEALHARAPDGARADRSVDVWILQQLTGALGGNASPQRLAAAIRAALGHIAPNGLLSPGEQELIAGRLFPDAYRQQIAANLVRLDAVLGELAAHAGAGWPQKPARYTCVSVDTVTRSAAGEVLTALLMQWLTVQVSAATTAVPAVIIAGADEIAGPHAERLSGACERRGVPVTLMFRHLRDDAARLIGGGTAAFMRLANHTEAEQAATYIGRRHTYVISSYTATRGGNQTSTQGSSDGYGTSDSRSDSRNRGWQDSGLFASAAPPAAGAAPTAPAPPETGPPPHPRPTAPAGARRRPGSGSTSTPSSPQPCRTCPSTPCCSPTGPAAACNSMRSNATRRSPASPASAPRRCRRQAASSTAMCRCTATRRPPSPTPPTRPSPPPPSTRRAQPSTPARNRSRPGPASSRSCRGGRRTSLPISNDHAARAGHRPYVRPRTTSAGDPALERPGPDATAEPARRQARPPAAARTIRRPLPASAAPLTRPSASSADRTSRSWHHRQRRVPGG